MIRMIGIREVSGTPQFFTKEIMMDKTFEEAVTELLDLGKKLHPEALLQVRIGRNQNPRGVSWSVSIRTGDLGTLQDFGTGRNIAMAAGALKDRLLESIAAKREDLRKTLKALEGG